MGNEAALVDWYKDEGDNTYLLSHPLTENSVAFDVGGYEGNWSVEIAKRYNCFIEIFEPVGKAYNVARVRFENNPKVRVHNYGLSGQDKVVGISLNGDKSCTWLLGPNLELVTVLDVKRCVVSPIDLISINIEGDEYDLLSEMIKSDVIKYCRRLQIQFHDNYLSCEKLRDDIRKKLRETHQEVYNYPFVWECWELK